MLLALLGMGACACSGPSTVLIGGDEPEQSAPVPSGAPEDVHWAWLFEQGETRVSEVDASGHGRDGTLRGQPSPSDPAPNGRPGNARGVFLNGGVDGADLASGHAGLGAFTFALWLKPSDVTNGVPFHASDEAGIGWIELYLESGFVHLVDTDPLQGATLLAPDVWSFVAIARDEAGRSSLYVDGEPAVSADGSLEVLERFALGGIDAAPYRGELDELFVYARTLSAGEIQALRGSP